jgi:hypothetical protein
MNLTKLEFPLPFKAYDSAWTCRGIADATVMQKGTYPVVERHQFRCCPPVASYLKRIS